MNLKILLFRRMCLLMLILFTTNTFSQCFEIQSILVDACNNSEEGFNEMVRFKVGNTPLNVSTLSAGWPNNSWKDIVQDATTALKVSQLNADIVITGGCGHILEPSLGVLPSNATVILVTSFNMSPNANTFGPLSEDVYMIFQNNPLVNVGHFANYSTALPNDRTFLMTFGAVCLDSVTYDKTLLTRQDGTVGAADGATVNFTPAGIASYVNYGCKAPIPPFSVDAGPATLIACAGTTIALNGSAFGQHSVAWSSLFGSFSSASKTTTNYTIPLSSGGSVIAITLEATNSCGQKITDVIKLNVTSNTTPDFDTTLSLCNGATAPILAATSPNGISGTWNPAVIDNTAKGTYTFTPNTGQCANTTTLTVIINPIVTPDFDTTLSLCNGATAPILAATSPNGISGTWSPAVIDNTANGTYTFTPDTGQCGATATLAITITSFKYSITQDCIDNNYLIKVVPDSNISNSDYTYSWINDKGDLVGNNNSTFNFTEYIGQINDNPMLPSQFKVIVGNASCEVEEIVEITSSLCGVPNAISPNDDGINDNFDLTSFNVNNITIFNRWGKELYHFEGNYVKQWHGQWKGGNKLPSGTYYYIISNDGGDQKAGWIFLTY